MKAAIVGGGVIGAGWAARFALNGWDAEVVDPDSQLHRKLEATMAKARRSLPRLYDVPLPPEGRVRICSLADAVDGADWIQESGPERIDVKRELFRRIQTMNRTSTIGSSTSSIRPSVLQEGAIAPEQIIIVHPFNPVYLLPLVEIVGSAVTLPETPKSAMDLMASLGMRPLLIKREIDGFIGNRLQEAMWREGLWLIKDGIATASEIDDAVRYGFGLRCAQMGQFETFRIGGGEGGFHSFLKQFGPWMKAPLSKLMDVPDLDDQLVKMIVTQSDEQSGHLSIDALEQLRDDNLVGIIRALKGTGSAAGQLVLDHERNLKKP